jgi:hypothetical protein
VVNNTKRISKEALIESLKSKDVIKDQGTFDYNMDYLIKAFCVKKVEENGKIYFEITQSGQVVEYLEK